eukprot:Tbor_TRINITY_DN3726_c0_g1::TRINITY_DN3726_c0_g1_i2::g.2452::m.2452
MPAGRNDNPFHGNGIPIVEFQKKFNILWQQMMDRIVPFAAPRWVIFTLFFILFCVRIYVLDAFYIVAYGVCVHLLYYLVLAITPNDPDALNKDMMLPESEREHKPFVPKVMEFVVWKNMLKVLFIGFFLTFISFIDIPVFTPILVLYFLVLFGLQVGSRVSHMIKHKYVPWNSPKTKYVSKSDR